MVTLALFGCVASFMLIAHRSWLHALSKAMPPFKIVGAATPGATLASARLAVKIIGTCLCCTQIVNPPTHQASSATGA